MRSRTGGDGGVNGVMSSSSSLQRILMGNDGSATEEDTEGGGVGAEIGVAASDQ